MELEESKTNKYLIAIAVLLPGILALVASSATNACQQNIAGYFGSTQYETNTVITSYIIANGIMLPLTAFLMKKLGSKLFMTLCLVLFTIGCGLCVIAPTLKLLILARIVQGIGGGCILQLCQAILLSTFSGPQVSIAMGLYGIEAMFSPLIGPFIGGYLTDNFSWKWVFIANIPLCIIALLLVKTFLPDDKKTKEKYNKKFDTVGFTAMAIAMGCLQIVLDKGEQFNWFDTTWICWVSGISVVAFVFFYVWELECKNPVIDIRVFKDKNFLLGTAISSIVNILLYSTLLLTPMFVQSLLGYSPSASGLAMLPRAIICAIGLLVVGGIAEYVEHRLLTIIGFVIMGISVLWMCSLSTTASMDAVVWPNILLCIGVPIAFVPISSLSFLTLPKSKNADAAALHALFKNIVTAMSTALSATFISRFAQVHQNYLVGDLSYHNPIFRAQFTAIQHKFMVHYPTILATRKANGLLYKELIQQSKLAAFYDIFALLALLAIITIPFIFLLKSKKTNELQNNGDKKNRSDNLPVKILH